MKQKGERHIQTRSPGGLLMLGTGKDPGLPVDTALVPGGLHQPIDALLEGRIAGVECGGTMIEIKAVGCRGWQMGGEILHHDATGGGPVRAEAGRGAKNLRIFTDGVGRDERAHAGAHQEGGVALREGVVVGVHKWLQLLDEEAQVRGQR